MKRIFCLALLASMTGCTMLDPIETPEQENATTVVDAVEGDKSSDESSGIVDTLRGRTDQWRAILLGPQFTLSKNRNTTQPRPVLYLT